MKLILALTLLPAAARAGQAAAPRPRLAVIIDDFGLDHRGTPPNAEWWAQTWPFTASVMPESPLTKESAEGAVKAGKGLMIHFPFDPFLRLKLPKDAADPGDEAKVSALLEKAIKQVPGAKGLNNHRSLHATMNRPLMAWFMQRLKPTGLFFVDSRVSGKTVAYAEAKKAGIPTAINEFFLDEGPKSGEAFCLKWLHAAVSVARRHGSAIVIGHHYYRGTLDCLSKRIPEVKKEGVDVVLAADLVRRSAPSRP
ncbi:MAG: divergent polysaccharide deacetylase family protein [Elusimicrobia bacterium]|nr:divergent polysaccharide deacetylase family protein [Elusimicrobiota bacterium]